MKIPFPNSNAFTLLLQQLFFLPSRLHFFDIKMSTNIPPPSSIVLSVHQQLFFVTLEEKWDISVLLYYIIHILPDIFLDLSLTPCDLFSHLSYALFIASGTFTLTSFSFCSNPPNPSLNKFT